jgi:hypothetical protein
MSFPVFASGDVLNATDMNAVGLWLVKSQTIGTAVSSVTVTGAFSADYDNYLITVSGGVGSTSSSIGLRLGSSSTGYYGGLVFLGYTSGVITAFTTNNGTNWVYSAVGTTNSLAANIVLLNPFNVKTTSITSSYMDNSTSGGGGAHNGFHNSATSFTAFTLLAGSGTLTGGTIRVYGMRN